MPRIFFHEGRESGVLDGSTSLVIPDQGELPPIPFIWNGQPPRIDHFISSKERATNPDPDRRSYSAIFTDQQELPADDSREKYRSLIIIWVRERNQWVAFSHLFEADPYDPYGFRDEFVHLEGPWSLDETHQRAVIEAYRSFRVDITKVPSDKIPELHLGLVSRQKLRNTYLVDLTAAVKRTFWARQTGYWGPGAAEFRDALPNLILEAASRPEEIALAIHFIFAELYPETREESDTDHHSLTYGQTFQVTHLMIEKALALANNTAELRKRVTERFSKLLSFEEAIAKKLSEMARDFHRDLSLILDPCPKCGAPVICLYDDQGATDYYDTYAHVCLDPTCDHKLYQQSFSCNMGGRPGPQDERCPFCQRPILMTS